MQYRRTGHRETSAEEIDVLPASDTAYADVEVGTVDFYDVPVYPEEDMDWESFAEEIGRRCYARDGEARVSMDLVLTNPVPLLALERGQIVETPQLPWKTIGNGMEATFAIMEKSWIVDGFRLDVSVENGVANINPVLYLDEV